MSKKHLIRTSALALTIAALPLGASVFSQNIPVAYADGNTTGNNGGSNSAGHKVGAEYLRYPSYDWGDNYCYTGLRIFVAPMHGFADDELDRAYKNFSRYKQYSLYAISGDSTFFTAADNGKLGYYNTNDKMIYPIKSGQILDKVENKIDTSGNISFSGTWKFEQILGANSGANPWMYSPQTKYDGKIPSNLSDLANWLNNQFNARLVSGELDLDEMLSKYEKLLKDSGVDTTNFPKTSDAFDMENWSIIVEPVFFASHFDDSPFKVNDAVALSYQDVFYPLNHALSYQAQDGTIAQSRSDGIPKIIDNTIRNFYADFDTTDFNGNTVSVRKGANGIGDATYGGISFYVTTGELRTGMPEIDINRNISVYSDNVKAASSTGLTANPSIRTGDASGSGFNNGNGWITITRPKTGQSVSQCNIQGMSDASSILGTTYWWGSNSEKTQFYNDAVETQGADKGRIKGLGRTNTVTTASDKNDAYTRLTGTDTSAFTGNTGNSDDDYILVESASAIVKSNTGTNRDLDKIDDFSVDSNAYGVKSVAIPVLTGKEIGVDNATKYVRSIGSSYSAKLTRGNNDITLTTGDDNILTGVASAFESDISSRDIADVQQHNYRVNPDNNAVENIIGNSITSNLDNADTGIRYNMKTGTYQGKPNGASKKSGIGVSLQFFVPDEKVTTYSQRIVRNTDGSVDVENADSNTYSIYKDSNYVDVGNSSQDKAIYVLAIPNTAANEALGVTASTGGASKLADTLFTAKATYARESGQADFIGVLNSDSLWSTVDYKLRSAEGALSENSEALTIVANGEDSRIYTGACTDTANGAFVGYSVYVIEDNLVTQPQSVEMILEAQRLNYVYPSLLGESSGYLLKTVGSDSIQSNDYHITNTNEYGGTLVSDQRRHDTMYSLLYAHKAVIGNLEHNVIFDNESNVIKTFTKTAGGNVANNEHATASFAVNLSRGAFGDSYVASSISSRGSFEDDYVRDVLGMTIGSKGSNTSGINSGETALYKTGSDKFRWSCDKSAFRTMTNSFGYGVSGGLGSAWNRLYFSPWADGEAQDNAGYDVSESIYRYATMDKSTGSNDSRILTSGRRSASGFNASLFSVESYNDVLKFYPEVAMMAYRYDFKNPQISSIADIVSDRLYVMGEKERSVKPSGLYGINVNNSAPTGINGTVKSDSVAAGSAAKSLSNKFGGLQVLYAGGNVNLAASGNFSIDLSGFVLDQIDKSEDSSLVYEAGTGTYNDVIYDNSDIRSTWGNSASVSLDKYKSWVNTVKSSLSVDVGLQVWNGSSLVREYNGYRASVGQISGGDVEKVESYALTYSNGAVVEDTAYAQLIQAIMNQANVSQAEAKDIFAESGINQSILNSIESSTNGKSGGASGFVNNWYDETVRTFVVRYYRCTPIKIQSVNVSDKIDINAGPSQTGSLFSNGYVGTWTMTVYMNKANASMPSLNIYNPKSPNYGLDSVLIADQPISGADFVIADATTADARR